MQPAQELEKERDHLRDELGKAQRLLGAAFHEEYDLRRAVAERDAATDMLRERNKQFMILLGAAKSLKRLSAGGNYTTDQIQLMDAVLDDSEEIAALLRDKQ